MEVSSVLFKGSTVHMRSDFDIHHTYSSFFYISDM